MEETKRKSGFAVASLVLGIIGLCTSFIPFVYVIAFILGFIGAIFAIVSLIKKASKGMAIAALIICILSVVIAYQSHNALSDSIDTFNNEMDKTFGNSTEEILKNDADVTLGKFEVKQEDYFTNTKLVVTVKNRTSETKSFDIQIEAVDSNGTRLDTDYIYANNLGAGQSQDFNVFEYVDEDNLQAMKNATFKIVEVSMY